MRFRQFMTVNGQQAAPAIVPVTPETWLARNYSHGASDAFGLKHLQFNQIRRHAAVLLPGAQLRPDRFEALSMFWRKRQPRFAIP
jgi:hypothetical protein